MQAMSSSAEFRRGRPTTQGTFRDLLNPSRRRGLSTTTTTAITAAPPSVLPGPVRHTCHRPRPDDSGAAAAKDDDGVVIFAAVVAVAVVVDPRQLRTLRDAHVGRVCGGGDDFDRWIRLLFHSSQMLYGTVFLETDSVGCILIRLDKFPNVLYIYCMDE